MLLEAGRGTEEETAIANKNAEYIYTKTHSMDG